MILHQDWDIMNKPNWPGNEESTFQVRDAEWRPVHIAPTGENSHTEQDPHCNSKAELEMNKT